MASSVAIGRTDVVRGEKPHLLEKGESLIVIHLFSFSKNRDNHIMANGPSITGGHTSNALFILMKLTAEMLLKRLVAVDPHALSEIGKIRAQILSEIDNAELEAIGVSDDQARQIQWELRQTFEELLTHWETYVGQGTTRPPTGGIH